MNLHLVEISPAMKEMQKKMLCDGQKYTTNEVGYVLKQIEANKPPKIFHSSVYNMQMFLFCYYYCRLRTVM